MAAPGAVDGASPFFASLAGQAAMQSAAAKTQESKKKEKSGVRGFDRLVREHLSESSPLDASYLPARLLGLPPEKILEGLLDDVHSSGDVLKESQLPANIVAYKDAVRSFMKFVVDHAFTVSESTSGGNILKRKKFYQVQIIDQKLEQLAAGILSNQKNQLGLLGKIEEINGLLVDLLS